MRKLFTFVLFVAAIGTIVALPAAANPPGTNGRIVFARFDPALDDDFIYTANPDGSHEQQLLATGAEGPRWSPDGTRIVVGPHDAAGEPLDRRPRERLVRQVGERRPPPQIERVPE